MESMQQRVLDILTVEQKLRWREMTGEPFHGQIYFGRGFGGKDGGLPRGRPRDDDRD